MNTPSDNSQYTVVARRYRPQLFSDLVGQGYISTALSNAIKQNRVGHAYLFTGARGVGKTSTARIFAKCLNCQNGPSVEPCNQCDSCEAVSIGEDVDVLEIDGASNRGIDEIRQLRSNAGIRPSRSRYKIYIIDEVHMLTQQAFNALLKTLEEPPAHVKFIFCTTDPQKIPITVLSRCQRFDFAPVQTDEIAIRLKEIAENEGVTADDAALALLARRANGSMRDSQSLLEQLFSFCDDNISVDEVNQLLGTADISRIVKLAQTMSAGDAAASMNHVDMAISAGVDAGQLTQQLLGFYRDMMAVRVGCGETTLLSCTAADLDELKRHGDKLGLQTILAIIQILDGAIVRMQSSVHPRTLLELAVVRICNLENLDSIADLVQALVSGGAVSVAPQPNASSAPSRAPAKKNETLSKPAATTLPVASPDSSSAPVAPYLPVEPLAKFETPVASQSVSTQPATTLAAKPQSAMFASDQIKSIWEQTLDELSDMTADMAREYEKIELLDPNNLAVTLTDSYNRDMCNRPERRQMLESALERIAGQKFRIDFLLSTNPGAKREVRKPKMTRRQQILQLHDTPIVKQAMEVFDAEIVDFHETKKQS